MWHDIDAEELNERIALNYSRLCDGYYSFPGVFVPTGEWPGDKEGRALLAFVSHYRMTGQTHPCMEKMLSVLGEYTDENYCFPAPVSGVIYEQQLSGHSWLLRGLCEHYLAFGDSFSLEAVKKIVKALYLPLRGKIASYRVIVDDDVEGAVSGFYAGQIGDWVLSTDTGCAFMCIDGLSAAYELLKTAELKELLDEMICFFASLDIVSLKLQTHCSLTAARGMMRMYSLTGEDRYLAFAKKIFLLYRDRAMTLTYQNYNWWGKDRSWTETCAVVDSIMLSGELFKATGEEKYSRLAARIYQNGLANAQRFHGGAGTDTIVTESQPILRVRDEECPFCCTMRLSEGLRYIRENASLLRYETCGTVSRDFYGRYADGDLLYAEVLGEGAEKYLQDRDAVTVDGHRLVPLLKLFRIPPEEYGKISQRVVFD